MIFWKGYGILVLVITIAIEALISLIVGKNNSNEDTAMAVGILISAVVIWIVGNKLNSSVKSRILIDKETGQEVVIKPDHTFFFIKMQYWAFIVGSIGLIALISNSIQHNNYKGTPNYISNNEPVQQQQLSQQQQEEQIRQQAYLDSIKRVQAIADSIEKETKLRLTEEDKQRKILDAADFIKSFSTSLMEKVSPNTGEYLTYNILDSESTYDDLTNTMNVVFETSWDAVPDYNLNSPYQTHIYKGKLILYGTGETRLEEISKNDVLIRAINANAAAEDIMDWLKKIDNNSN